MYTYVTFLSTAGIQGLCLEDHGRPCPGKTGESPHGNILFLSGWQEGNDTDHIKHQLQES